ncbi:MAG: MBL fold metallo-hydrolase [Sandaracinus sp.]
MSVEAGPPERDVEPPAPGESGPRSRDLGHGVGVLVALFGPVVLSVSLALVSGRGAPVAWLWIVVPLLAAVLAAIGANARRTPIVSGIGGLGLAGFLAFAWSFRAAPIPLREQDVIIPMARVPRGVAAYRVETGVIHRTASFGYRGGGLDTPRDFAMNAVLITHPAGDVLVDTGLGENVRAHLEEMPLPFRAVTDLAPSTSVAAQLVAIGYDRARLFCVVLTHAHWDHVSGAEDLVGAPLWVTASERAFLDEGWITAIARRVSLDRYRTYELDGPPALHAPRSHDVHGDGAIVIVPVPGHTPGSVAVLVTESEGRRFLLLGDLVWQREGITEREERPWLTRLGDSDPAEVRDQIAAVAALSRAHPEIVLVPAHDPRGYAEMRPLEALARP